MSKNEHNTQTTTATPKKGSGLAADIHAHDPGIETLAWYWIGAFPQCSGEGLNVGGINFPKINEDIRGKGGKTQRIPRIGALIQLNRSQIEEIRKRLPRRVIRFTEPLKPEEFVTDANGDEKRLGHQTDPFDFEQRRRRGYPIRIPTKEQIERAQANGRTLPRYVRGKFDEPAARYVFAQLCDNQERPTRGEAYPPSLEDVDIDWPE